MAKTKVLFLDTNNAARSQMAEAFLRQAADGRFDVYSAGLEPKGINPYARAVMKEVGVDLSGQWSKDVTEFLGRVHFGYLITVCDYAEQHCPTALMGIANRMYWAFEDPARFQGAEDETLARFREVRDQIEQRIRSWLAEQAR